MDHMIPHNLDDLYGPGAEEADLAPAIEAPGSERLRALLAAGQVPESAGWGAWIQAEAMLALVVTLEEIRDELARLREALPLASGAYGP